MTKSGLSLLLVLAVSACGGGNAHPPPPPPTDGGSVPFPRPMPSPPNRDASTDSAVADAAAATDGGLPPGCVPLPATGNGLALTFTSSGTSPEFRPSHAVASWVPTSCDDAAPQLVISLGDGCDLSGSHLSFQLERDAIQRGDVTIGFPLFVENPHPYVVRLVLPPSVSPGPSIWGDCPAAAGSITFDDVGWTAGSSQSASFDITLTDCSTTPALENMRANGSFSVTLTDAFEDVCTP